MKVDQGNDEKRGDSHNRQWTRQEMMYLLVKDEDKGKELWKYFVGFYR